MKIELGGLMVPLALVFVTLKLVDKIDWSWWWVLAPIWMPASIALAIAAFALVAALVVKP